MNTPLPAVTMAVTLAITGCSFVQNPKVDSAAQRVLMRHIEIEVEDLKRGLPCRVIDQRSSGPRDVLWRAEFEEGFCRRKAEETRLILETQGWSCRPVSAEERRSLTTRPTTTNPPFVVAAWHCLEGLKTILQQEVSVRSPVPVPQARPAAQQSPSASWGDEPLRAAVKRDLSTIGQDEIGDGTIVEAALGDLNDDGADDAVVILTREAVSGPPHRMLMAYLQSGEAYSLVDVWILKASDEQGGKGLGLAIENGTVRLGDCCEDPTDPTTLVLDNRKLAYADDG